MVTEGSWNINTFAQLGGISLATAPTPIGPAGNRVTMTNSLADSISVGSPNKGAAWEWVRYLASRACQSVVAQGGVVLPAIASEVPAAEARLAEHGMDITAFTGPVREGATLLYPVADHAADIDSIMDTSMQRVLSFGAEPESFTDANAEVNALFSRR
jgi:multiple sugar transport system substrate-binding protein